ncbi:GTPase domain-containing protein [Moraxella sp. ZJ142]|uniref:GTPase domain-containing protein n=1 Tax=Moraxella marmotae TaxID=3344520 RepID=UPI0035D46A25
MGGKNQVYGWITPISFYRMIKYFGNFSNVFFERNKDNVMVLPLIIGAALIGGLWFVASQWSGKHIAVLGGRGVGKTTFIEYLKTKRIRSDYHQTATVDKYEAMKVRIEGITLYISSGYDVSGAKGNHEEWRKQIEKADIVFYLLDINKVLRKDERYIKNTEQDLDEIKDSIARRQEKMTVFLIANHADEQPDYTNNFTKFEEKVGKQRILEQAVINLGGTKYCKVIIGSLKNEEQAKKLVTNILKSYDADNKK